MSSSDPVVVAAIKNQGKKSRMAGMFDAISNLVTGIGTSRDKNSALFYCDDAPLPCDLLEALFANNDLANTIVAKPVDDALRAWFTVERTETDEEEDELAHDIQLELERLKARELMKEGATWGRLFGGGGVILRVKGGGLPAMPLRDEDVTEVLELIPFDRQDLTAYTWYGDGRVQTYIWQPTPIGGVTAIQPTVIHESRMLMFGGMTTTRRRKQYNQGWDLSVLQRVYNVLKSFDSMWASTDAMFADASQAVFKMQGLIQSLAESDGEGREDVQTRLAFMDMVRSSAKAIMLDAGDKANGSEPESFEVVERSTLGTLDGVMQAYMVRLATAARMPLTVLLGMSPAGMDATGDSDMELYFNTIDVYRADELQPPLLRLVKMLAQTLGEDDVDDLKIVWPELSRPKPLDVATAEKMNIDGVVALVAAQTLLPEEAALNLNRIAPSLRLRVDLDARRKALKDGLAEVENREVGLGQVEAAAEVEAKHAPKPTANPPAKSGARKTKAKSAKAQT
jgi:phage-related protein (TIGR01555 family)